jgi:NADPH-dependent 2,4-dienoyl-CoA reductase/sulfur reductase-like enzyme/nitrite reductase/ring-hydroxylating ferredoxin subunit
MAEMTENLKPDFNSGFPVVNLSDGGMVAGQVDGEDAILARRGDEFFAVAAFCTHYHGPLADGLVVADTVRCPWHHACFSLRTGEALRAPALDPITCWRVERVGDTVYVRERVAQAAGKPAEEAANAAKTAKSPKVKVAPPSVVIVGGGAAGLAAADMLRREGYDGPLTMISADDSAPYDRPNLSKDFLAGKAQDDWIPLRAPDYYRDHEIELVLGSRVGALDIPQRRVELENGKSYGFGTLLLATGAEPIRLPIEEATDNQIYYLRTFADSRALVAKAESAKRVVVVGASFIGLEVAASLRSRGIDVHVVAPDKQPLERILGPEVGAFIRGLHEAQGVVFHLRETVSRINGRTVTLKGGSTLEADFMVLGLGVTPSVALAERAGLAMDRGITVNEFLETSAPGVFAAGDIARWPDPHSGERIRVEHWVVAERQGQVAAKNILGQRERFSAVPFFWSQHYDVALNYVGHAEKWDSIVIDGQMKEGNFAASYRRGEKTLAVATVSRDLQSLKEEAAMESR